MFCLGIMALGYISITRIPVQMLPEIKTTQVQILSELRGATPEEIEETVTTPIERNISTVPGILNVSSSSQREISKVIVNLSTKIDQVESINLLKDRIDSAGMADGTRTRILRIQPNSEPLFTVIVSPVSGDLLKAQEFLEDTLLLQIERVEGIALAEVSGSPKRILDIELNPIRSAPYGVFPNVVSDMILSKSKQSSAGEVLENGKKSSVKIGKLIETADDIGKIIVKKEKDKFLRIEDVATVTATTLDSPLQIKIGNTPGLILRVHKEAEANAVEVSKKVRKIISDFAIGHEDILKFQVLADTGKGVEASVDNVVHSVVTGGILASVIIYLMLQSAWSSFIVVTAIPLSLFITLILMFLTGISFNLMSLAGLALGVGMLVDNSTVVLDAIDEVKMHSKDSYTAAYLGAKRVGSAIAGSTFSSIAVFGPLTMMQGWLGMLFRDLAITICFSVFSSLIVALTVIPMLCALDKKKSDGTPKKNSVERSKRLFSTAVLDWRIWIRRQVLYPIWAFESVHLTWRRIGNESKRLIVPFLLQLRHLLVEPLLKLTRVFLFTIESKINQLIPWTINNTRKVLLSSAGITALGAFLFFSLGSEVFPDETMNQFNYRLEMPSGSPVSVLSSIADQIALKSKLSKVITRTASQIGEEASHLGKVTFETNASVVDSIQEINSILHQFPDLRFSRIKKTLVNDEPPIVVEIFEDSLEALKSKTNKVADAMAHQDWLAEVETSLKSDVQEIVIELDKSKMSLYGVDASSFSGPIKAILNPQLAGNLNINGFEHMIQVRMPDSYLNSVEKIKQFSTDIENDKKLFLSQISNPHEQNRTGLIEHSDRKRVARIIATPKKIDLGEAANRLSLLLKREFKDLHWELSGQAKSRVKNQQDLLWTISLSIFLIFLILASQFESFKQPIIILVAVPLCVVGVSLFLWIWQLNVSALVFVGFIVLVGASVNTSIVMVDFANQIFLEEHVSRAEAIRIATIKRLKPILVTTAANVFGHLPMAFASGTEGSAMQRPLAVTLVGGLVSSVLLTILVVPPIYIALTKEPHAKVA